MTSLNFNYEYKLYEDIYCLDRSNHIGYGISVENTAMCREVMRIEDISTSKTKIETLVKKCNDLQLSPTHIFDIIEDFIVAV